MATFTGGTTSTTALPYGLTYQPGYASGMAAADIATIGEHILNDLVNTNPIMREPFSSNGLLFVPNRGVLQMRPGDVVFVDNTGWPILVSKASINNGSTVWNT
jgi:hypothetical protein